MSAATVADLGNSASRAALVFRVHRSVLAIPLIGAPESLRRSGPEARRDRAATRAQRALLTASTQGFRMRAPEGWPRLQQRAPPLTLRRAARAIGRGVECASAPTWPGGPKEGSRRPGAPRSPDGQPATGGCRAAPQSAVPSRGASQDRCPAPARRAPRALDR
jgi:hypothetical protein